MHKSDVQYELQILYFLKLEKSIRKSMSHMFSGKVNFSSVVNIRLQDTLKQDILLILYISIHETLKAIDGI